MPYIHVYEIACLFRGVSLENVIKCHIYIKLHVFRGASLEIVIKFHEHVKLHVLGAGHKKISLNSIYASNYLFLWARASL